MHLRDFHPGDLEALYRLDQACFEPGIAYSRSELARFLSLSTAQSVVAEVDGRIAGFAVGHVTSRRLGHVVTLDVAREHRRTGIARALMTELIVRFAAERVREVRLEVDVNNETAIAFYERLGFGRRRGLQDYYGPSRPAWEMRLELPRSFGERAPMPRA